MVKCVSCGKNVGFWDISTKITPSHKKIQSWGYNIGEYICYNCVKKHTKEEIKKKKELKIECPFCHKEFHPERKTPTSAIGNILRGAIFVPWGHAQSTKNIPYVECPHCKMRIPQG
jgi:DNA-directed RNA polymerase subunit RPC12/RpoP